MSYREWTESAESSTTGHASSALVECTYSGTPLVRVDRHWILADVPWSQPAVSS